MDASLTVRVPATSANLGPGFDAIGVALTRVAEVTIAIGDSARRGRPDRANAPMRRMVRAAIRAAYRHAAQRPPENLDVDVDSDIPVGRGLGVSAAARAAGLVAANTMLDGMLDDQTLLDLGTELEGHADNIAPALRGGLQVAAVSDGRVTCVPVPVAAGIRCVGFTPEFSMPTHESRELLPASLTRADAVHNSSRAALLVAALVSGRWDALEVATDDRLHQPARSALFPQMYELFDAVRAAGAYTAYLSGGGSTLMALAAPERAEGVRAAFAAAAAERRVPGDAFICDISEQGATVATAALG